MSEYEPLHVQGSSDEGAPLSMPEVTHAYGLFIHAPTVGKERFLLAIDEQNRRILTLHSDATVTLGEGVTLDEASRAFWDRVQFEGKTLRQRAEAAQAALAELRARKEHTVSKKNRRQGRERIEMDYATFMRLVDTSEGLRRQIAAARGVIEAHESLHEIRLDRLARQKETMRQLTEERDVINAAIRALGAAMVNVPMPAKMARACDALCRLLPQEAAEDEFRVT